MRKLFWVLLLANVILFGLMQRGALDWLGWNRPGVQPQPELNADKIRLLPAPQSPPAKPLSAAPASAPVPAHTPTCTCSCTQRAGSGCGAACANRKSAAIPACAERGCCGGR